MKNLLQIPFALASLLILAVLLVACGQPASTDAGTPTTPTATPTTSSVTPAATPTKPDVTPAVTPTTAGIDTSSPYQVDSCTTFELGEHSQALASEKYYNPAYGFSTYYNGEGNGIRVLRPWVMSQDASGIHFYPKGSANGEDLTVRLDDSSSETPEAFLHRLIGPVASQQNCMASSITFGGDQSIAWTSIAVLVTIKATNAQTRQLCMAAKNPKTGKVLAAIFTNGPNVSDNTNQEDLRYMMDMFTFI